MGLFPTDNFIFQIFFKVLMVIILGTLCSVMVNKQDWQTIATELKYLWQPENLGFQSDLS